MTLISSGRSLSAWDKALQQRKSDWEMHIQSEAALLTMKVGDLPFPYDPGITNREAFKFGVSEKGNPTIVVGNPAWDKFQLSLAGDYGERAVNAVGDLILLRLYERVTPGGHIRWFDESQVADNRRVAYFRNSDGSWTPHVWYGYTYTPTTYADEQHRRRAEALHDEISVLHELMANQTKYMSVFAGSNADRYRRRIEEVMEMTLADARRRKEDDFFLSSVAGSLHKKAEGATVVPVVVGNVDLTKVDLPVTFEVTLKGTRYNKTFGADQRDYLEKFLSGNAKEIEAGSIILEIVAAES